MRRIGRPTPCRARGASGPRRAGGATSGFALLEALVAAALLAAGAASLSATFLRLRVAVDDLRDQAVALRLARSELDALRLWPAPSRDTVVEAGGAVFSSRAGSVTAASDPLAPPAPLALSVTVSWTDGAGRRRTVSLDSQAPGVDPTIAALSLWGDR